MAALMCARRFLSCAKFLKSVQLQTNLSRKCPIASGVRTYSFDSTSLSHVSNNHATLYEYSLKNPENFWGLLGREKIKWIDDFHTVTTSDMNIGKHAWFLGGKLNVSGIIFR